ncbi:conserved hypothetical protein [Hyphomicrobium denitrificans ATCC 51888]|uniref:Uncharacterized protein n=1 Tax=Hyphomicrobium denitrificans (strain ATCC 51888 / DSM 1869 / NCIMB 11706 / TK 0415) TaxID=582899 RepID=D8JVU8_HYPDA|nr:conserved hypothetical protein [Hyphomicrobium denitrificans ATCC 51888]
MTHSLADDFKDRINGFLERTGMSPSAFGRQAVNDGSFVADLNSGEREFRLSTIEKVDKFIADFDADLAHAATVPHDVQRNCLT